MGLIDETRRFWSTAPLTAIASTLQPHRILFQHLKCADQIIDFGCGTGKLVCDLQRVGYQHASGIDINPNAIAEAHRNASALPSPQVRFHVGDVRATSFTTGSFDVVLSQALFTVVLQHEDRLAVVREARRVLRKGGLLYLADFAQAWHNAIYRERYRVGATKYAELGIFDAYDSSSGELIYTARHFTEQELVELLHSCSFQIVCFRYQLVRTRTGNRIYGMFLVAVSS